MSVDLDPPGLHVQLVAYGRSLRLALWLERYLEPGSYLRPPGFFGHVQTHPGCVTEAPPWMPPGSRPATFLARLPRLSNGHPTALPGVIGSWEPSRVQWGVRKSELAVFQVRGWVLPIESSLGPLRSFLIAYREAHGDGLMAPQTAPLLAMLGELQQRLEEGPLLPTLWTPGTQGAGAPAAVGVAPVGGWVPPVPLGSVIAWSRGLRAVPTAAVPTFVEVTGALRDLLDTPAPTRLAWLAIDLLAAASGQPADAATLEALGRPAAIEALHRHQGSCAYPTHPVFSPPDLPPGHLHLSVRLEPAAPPLAAPAATDQAATDRAPAAEGRWRCDLTIRDGKRRVGLGRLLARGVERDALVDDGDALWQQPGRVLARDWSLGLADVGWLLGRPEILTGSALVSRAEAESLLEHPERKADRGEAADFFRETGASSWSRPARGSFVRMTTALDGGEGVRVQVRWELQGTLEQDEGLRRARFAPELSLLVGARSLAVAEAEQLLAGSRGRFLEVHGTPVERQQLHDAVDLARARRKVIEKLTRAGTIDWGQALELEDEWLSDSRLSSLFSESWRSLLGALEDGAGVPRLRAPEGFRGELRPYQERGVSWLVFLTRHGLGACLADDMGLGKTVQVLAALEHRRAAGAGVALVICPTAVVGNWAREARKFVPAMRVVVHQGDQRADDRAFRRLVAGSDLIVTSYALALIDAELLRPHRWSTLVVDEAQHLKNPQAKRTRLIKELNADACIALTGTPVENRLNDLWSIFDLLNRGLLGGGARFARAFAGPVRRGDERALERLQRRLAPFLLRRTKRDPRIAPDLPDKQEQDIECPLTREQRALYQAMVEATVEGLEDRHGIARRAHVLAALTHFKQICDHPEVFEPERAGKLLGRSGKLDRACELIEELLAEDQAILVFTQFVRMGEVLRAALEQHLGVEALFYHGGLSPRVREGIVEDFQAPDGPPVLIVSLRAGGTGLNLTRASAVIHYDRWWNPAVEDQATDRAHRIGQTQKVNVYRFITRGTVEERVGELLAQKRAMAGQLLGGVGDEAWLTELDDRQLASLFALEGDTTAETDRDDD